MKYPHGSGASSAFAVSWKHKEGVSVNNIERGLSYETAYSKGGQQGGQFSKEVKIGRLGFILKGLLIAIFFGLIFNLIHMNATL